MTVRRRAAGAAILATVTAFSLIVTSPASAAERRPAGDNGQAAVVKAMQRDLGLSAGGARNLIEQQDGVAALSQRLEAKLGSDFAGSWFDHESGKLVVAVSAAGRAGQVKAAGAQAKIVKHSLRTLNTIKAELDKLGTLDRQRAARSAADVAKQRAQLAGVVSWAVDTQRNQVVVKIQKGKGAKVAASLARHGDAVRIEQTELKADLAADYLDGGDPYNGCSVGFNVSRDGVGYFLTAGHCGTAGNIAKQGGITIGPFVESWFPNEDDALVRNDNSAYWMQGPWVFAYAGNPDTVYNISGYLDSPVGTAVCKSGKTTGLTCGWIRAVDVTVNYTQGAVYGLTQHSACAEPGDSGGSNISSSGGRNYAEGMTSGMMHITGDTRCLEKVPGAGESVSYYYPIADSIGYYGVSLMTM